MTTAATLLQRARLVFWDFDGVIKDSVDVKTRAFERLFARFGADVAARVRRHHQSNGGMSRYEKMPLYLSWAGQDAAAEQVADFCARFADEVRDQVIESPWVPGVREYLARARSVQRAVLVTGTPQEEMRAILEALDLGGCFSEVHGAPQPKADAIREVLARHGCAPELAVAIGDSSADQHAAEVNGVPFVLRRTPLNGALQARAGDQWLDDFAALAEAGVAPRVTGKVS